METGRIGLIGINVSTPELLEIDRVLTLTYQRIVKELKRKTHCALCLLKVRMLKYNVLSMIIITERRAVLENKLDLISFSKGQIGRMM